MISENLNNLLNQLVQLEHQSSYLYEAMSAYMDQQNYMGMSHWLRLQSNEERGHALKIVDYIADRNGRVALKEIPAQRTDFGTPYDTFLQVLKHEQLVTDSYEQAYDYVNGMNDQQTIVLLQDFLREQTEEVAQAEIIVGRLKITQNDPAGVLVIDQELGQRTTTAG